ncbi:MAG: DUF192 domain-containing protein [Planctomycetota bacterium]
MADAKHLIPSRFALLPTTVALILFALTLGGCANDAASGGTQRVEIKGEVFTLELAMDRASRFQGLSDRDFIAPDGGMLFVFPYEADRAFVMRRCLVPIDIMYLDPKGVVLNTHAMQIEPPGTREEDLKPYRSEGKSALVIELAGGTVERLGVKKGDQIDLPIVELKRRAQ